MAQQHTLKPDLRAVIVCCHVADDRRPILRAVRDVPTMGEDSGWQFLCDSVKNEDPEDAKVWLVEEVVKYEPSLSEFIDELPGIVLTRKDARSSWRVSRQ